MEKETVLFQCLNFNKELKKKLLIRKARTGSPNLTQTTEEVLRLGLSVLNGKK